MVASCLEPRPALIGPYSTTARQQLDLRIALGLDVIGCVRDWSFLPLKVASTSRAWPCRSVLHGWIAACA